MVFFKKLYKISKDFSAYGVKYCLERWQGKMPGTKAKTIEREDVFLVMLYTKRVVNFTGFYASLLIDIEQGWIIASFHCSKGDIEPKLFAVVLDNGSVRGHAQH